MKYYTIINTTDNNCDMGFKCKSLKEAKQSLKDLKRFDKEQGCPFDEIYIIKEVNYGN